MAYEALIMLLLLALLLFITRLWPILLLVILGIFIATLRLLFLSSRNVPPTQPPVLLPSCKSDSNKQTAYCALIEDINAKYGNTVIMVTHNEAIKQMADHVIKLRDGIIRTDIMNESKMKASEIEW